MKHSSINAKGREFEKAIMHLIREKGLDDRARRTGGSGSGLEKGDISTNLQILGRNANIECKNQKTMSHESWWKQTEKQCLGYSEPLLVFKFHNEPMAAAKVTLYFETLLDLIKKSKEPKTTNETSKEEKWKIQRAIESMRVVLKLFE